MGGSPNSGASNDYNSMMTNTAARSLLDAILLQQQHGSEGGHEQLSVQRLAQMAMQV
jgi:hypothetical protein